LTTDHQVFGLADDAHASAAQLAEEKPMIGSTAGGTSQLALSGDFTLLSRKVGF